jgi:hypothetical protein
MAKIYQWVGIAQLGLTQMSYFFVEAIQSGLPRMTEELE